MPSCWRCGWVPPLATNRRPGYKGGRHHRVEGGGANEAAADVAVEDVDGAGMVGAHAAGTDRAGAGGVRADAAASDVTGAVGDDAAVYRRAPGPGGGGRGAAAG